MRNVNVVLHKPSKTQLFYNLTFNLCIVGLTILTNAQKYWPMFSSSANLISIAEVSGSTTTITNKTTEKDMSPKNMSPSSTTISANSPRMISPSPGDVYNFDANADDLGLDMDQVCAPVLTSCICMSRIWV